MANQTPGNVTLIEAYLNPSDLEFAFVDFVRHQTGCCRCVIHPNRNSIMTEAPNLTLSILLQNVYGDRVLYSISSMSGNGSLYKYDPQVPWLACYQARAFGGSVVVFLFSSAARVRGESLPGEFFQTQARYLDSIVAAY